MPTIAKPLTDAELERLDDILYDLNSGEAMSLEEMDGFFCSLICSPEVVPPSEYLPLLWGEEDLEQSGFKSIEEAQEALTLVTRHWNTIAETLLRDEPYPVFLGEDANGDVTGQEWALGFMQGMSLREKGWGRLTLDTQSNEALLPVTFLTEDDEHPISDDPATPEEREAMLDVLDDSVLAMYRYFRTQVTQPSKAKKHPRPKNG